MHTHNQPSWHYCGKNPVLLNNFVLVYVPKLLSCVLVSNFLPSTYSLGTRLKLMAPLLCTFYLHLLFKVMNFLLYQFKANVTVFMIYFIENVDIVWISFLLLVFKVTAYGFLKHLVCELALSQCT